MSSIIKGDFQQAVAGVDYAAASHTQAETTITFTDTTTNNASTSTHGYLPKLGGGSTNFLRADGTWAAPPSGGSVTDANVVFSDVTTNNASTSKHGYLPKLGGGSTNFLRADGTWAAPPSGGTVTDASISFSDVTTNNASTSKHGFLPKLAGGTTNFLRADGSWAAPPSGTGGTTQMGTDVTTVGVVVNSDASASSNTTILKNLFLNSANPVFLPQGTISFNDTLTLGAGVKVFATPKTVLKLLTNVNGIVVNDRTVLEDLTLMVPTGYTQNAIFIDGTKPINTCTARNLRILGTSGYTGTGIRATALGKNDYVAFVDYDNVYIKNMDVGIYIEDGQVVPPVYPVGWANANRFTNVTFYTNTGIYLKGNPSGNQFDFQYQTVPSSVNGIYCEGSENLFSGFIWDTRQYGSTGMTATFAQKSTENVIALPPACIENQYIVDNGTDNLFVYDNQIGSQLKPLNTRASYTVFSDIYRKNKPNFFGVQDDCLAFLDKRGATVTVTGSLAANPGPATLFNPRYTGSYYCFNDPSVTRAVVEIDTSSNYIDNLFMIGMSFIDGLIPADYTIELITTAGGSYYPWIQVTGNKSSYILHELEPYGVKVYKMKITMTKAVYNPTLNPNKQINLSQIYGANAGVYAGGPFLFRDGGAVYGDIDLNKNRIKNKVWESGATAGRPSAPAQYQEFFDTTLGKPIWRVGSVWKDAMGTTV